MVNIHPSAVVDKTAELGADVVVGPNSVIGADTKIGDGTVLDACVVINGGVTIGKNNQIYANTAIGKNPQVLGLKMDSRSGPLIIGDNNIIRENVTIHSSMHEDGKTEIGSDNMMMVGSHIGHDVVLEDKCVLSNHCQIGGHCKIGTGVWMSGLAAMHQFVTIGKWVYAAGLSGINHDVPPFVIVCGHYPPTVRAINKRGLDRAGLDKQAQNNIFAAFKKLYRQPGALVRKAEAMIEEDIDDNVHQMCDAVIKSSQHRFGRYLEQFR